jgi:hypothetical protein
MLKSGLLSLGVEGKARLLSDTTLELSFTVEPTPFAR